MPLFPKSTAGRVFTIMMALLFGPLAVSYGLYLLDDPQPPWWKARHESSRQAPDPATHAEAVVQVYAARAYRWRGVFATHTWIALKDENASDYERYDVVGWNVVPRVKNWSVADGNWYGRKPELVYDLRGEKAQVMIPKIRQAVADYPHGERGDYVLWPGPNSNSFVGYVARQIPEMSVALPPNAVGKDFHQNGFAIFPTPSNTGWQVSFGGYVGAAFAQVEGLEFHIFGQTLGIDFLRPALKFPGLGRIGFPARSHAP